MCHRVAQQHRLRLGKFTVIEHEHEFAAVGVEALNRVWDPARKKPKIVFFHVGDKTLAICVDRRNPRCPVNMMAHSPAVCQCSSRTPPAVSLMFTPASVLETGNSRTVTSRDHPPS